jgi:hypothetical protein
MSMISVIVIVIVGPVIVGVMMRPWMRFRAHAGNLARAIPGTVVWPRFRRR